MLINAISQWAGKLDYPHFSKPKAEFIGEMIYGIEASQDVKLSEIARSLGEEIMLKKTSERLSRNLKTTGLGERLNEIIAKDGAKQVKDDTLIVVDSTDVHKAYARRMEYLELARWKHGRNGERILGLSGFYSTGMSNALSRDDRQRGARA